MKISSVDLHVGTNSVNSEPKSISRKLYSHAEDATVAGDVADVDVDDDDDDVVVALLVNDVIVFDN